MVSDFRMVRDGRTTSDRTYIKLQQKGAAFTCRDMAVMPGQSFGFGGYAVTARKVETKYYIRTPVRRRAGGLHG